ncbi:hypothetical protein MTR67_015766 [Solanum verrucosum]|uniref:Uncharacterized protein n=1 Tax=Solanum verrucosum TaxID=315347 RepID=A0AAF0QFM1_SOLVR|nr:hypothetical protein MTR67_015766 [Solanum verrucosum]
MLTGLVDKQACYCIHMLHPCMGVSDMVFQFQYEEVVSREGGEGPGSLAAALLSMFLLMEHPLSQSITLDLFDKGIIPGQ